jgi:hypothetical protein
MTLNLSLHHLRLEYISGVIFTFGAGSLPFCHIILHITDDLIGIALILVLSSIVVLIRRGWQGRRIHVLTLVFLVVFLAVNVTNFGFVQQTQAATLLGFTFRFITNETFPVTDACFYQAIRTSILSSACIILNDGFMVSSVFRTP